MGVLAGFVQQCFVQGFCETHIIMAWIQSVIF